MVKKTVACCKTETAPGQTGRDSLKKHALKRVTLASVDETLSAAGVRPARPGEERRSFR